MLNLAREILSLVPHFIWPGFCPACGRIGVSFCEKCLEGALSPLPAFCLDCGGRYGVPCCVDSVPCFAAAAHSGLARRFLINFKYHNARAAGLSMGRLLACLAPAQAQAAPPRAVVPVPLHPASERAFNQSKIIAEGFTAETAAAEVRDVLRWRGSIGRQVGKKSGAGRSLPPGAMESAADLTGRRIILIDDVYTTGATLRAARDTAALAGGFVLAAFVWSRRVRPAEIGAEAEGNIA